MGSAFVERFVANGDSIVATDLAGERLDRIAAAYPGKRVVTVVGDVSAESDSQRIAEVAREHFGRIDVLVHAAGQFPIKPFEEMSANEWQRIIDINLTGAFLMAKAVLPLMKGRGWGRMVFIGSASIFEGVPGQAHYVAAKAGVVGFVRSLAMEIGKYGITANIVAPGLTVTPPVRERFPQEMIDGQAKLRAISRDEQAEDLVGATFFLASPDAGFMSGQTLCVDGGKTKL